jgi:hypothetical protein
MVFSHHLSVTKDGKSQNEKQNSTTTSKKEMNGKNTFYVVTLAMLQQRHTQGLKVGV